MHVQNTVECISMLGNTNLCFSEGHAMHKRRLQNTILCTTEVHVHAQKCMSLLRNASLCTSEVCEYAQWTV